MPPTTAGRVVVIGGGVAGIAAAARLTQAGRAVTLVEMRPRLGGRATSVPDPTSAATPGGASGATSGGGGASGGGLIDNCQHVVMRCCTALLSLYETLGVANEIAWHRRFHFLHADGTQATLDRGVLPAPLHFAGAFARFKGLGVRDKVGIGRAMARIACMTRPRRDALNAISFDTWLRRMKQTDKAVERFWGVTILSACNETLDRVAAGYAVQVFAQGMLASRDGYEMGLSRVPLARLYDAAEPMIRDAGGTLRLATTAKSLVFDDAARRVRGVVLNDGTRLEAEHVISALPFEALARLANPELARHDARLQRLDGFEVSPIIGLHLWVRASDGKPALALPHVVFTGSPLHWLFDRGVDARGVQHLHGVISAAHALVDTPNAELLAMAMGELRRVMAARGGRGATVEMVDGRVFKERRATFSVLPGSDALRPTTRGAVGNLYLAGDWCATGWPATMEGAARSGFAAADAVRGH